MSKYYNHKVKTFDGVFDSKKEYERWLHLKHLEDTGFISQLDRQTVFELIPAQKDALGKCIERKCVYKADFTYKQDGKLIVEDVKSKYTRKLPEYIIKRKLMLYLKGIKVVEI